MAIYFDTEELVLGKSVINPNLAYGASNSPDFTSSYGSTSYVSWTAKSERNWDYRSIKIKGELKKGDKITISMKGILTGPQASGFYKATIYSQSTRGVYEVNAGDTAWLKSNQRDSKTIIITEDSIPSDPPMLFIYAGTAGKTAGNTIVVDHIKVEKSSVATPWIPAIEDQDVVMKSDFDSLKSELDNLKSHMGG